MTLDRSTLRLVASWRFGNSAVVLVVSDQSGTYDGTPFSMMFRYTDKWVLEDDRWRLAVRHASAAPP